MTKTCESCSYFAPEGEALGVCRRYPPAKPSNFSDEAWSQPIVRKDGVCGEYVEKG